MAAVRLLLAWLLLAALPLQGFAAAATLLCGPAHHGAAAASVALAPAAHPFDRDTAHGHGHDHAAAASPHEIPSAELPAAHAGVASAGTDTGHSCNLCSAACHGVGLASQPAPVALASVPPVPLTEPFQRFDSRPAPVPDKPPRA